VGTIITIEERFIEQKPLGGKPHLAAPAKAGCFGMTVWVGGDNLEGAFLACERSETADGNPLNGIYFQRFGGSDAFLHRPAMVRQQLQG